MKLTFKLPTRNQIRDLADQEFCHFQELKIDHENGHRPNVNPRECQHYMNIWGGIITFMNEESHEWKDLAPFEKQEILEAIEG